MTWSRQRIASATVPVLLVLSLAGLVLIQYRYLVIGLRLEKTVYDRSIQLALDQIRHDLETDNKLPYLLAAALSQEEGRFSVGQDTLQAAAQRFLKDFLEDRLLRQGLDLSFSFSLEDGLVKGHFIQSAQTPATQGTTLSYEVRPEGMLLDFCQCKPLLRIQVLDLLPFLIAQLNGLTIPFLLLMVVIALCFLWYVRITRRHRKLDQIKNDFINNLTHELNTPVFSIRLASNLLQQRVDPALHPLTNTIQLENKRLQSHIDKVLDLASLDHHEEVMKLEAVSLHGLLAGLLPTLEGRIGEGELRTSFAASHDIVLADPTHLANAVSNLLDNACKYGGQPLIVRLETRNEGRRVIVTVTDNGTGIAKEEQRRIFDKFYRVSQGDRHPVKGFGLGLSYVAHVVKAHRGKVSVQSQPGQGAEFAISLPLHFPSS